MLLYCFTTCFCQNRNYLITIKLRTAKFDLPRIQNMSITTIIIIVIAVGSVFAGILLIKQSASKFELSDEQQDKVDSRKTEQLKKDQEQE